MSFLVDVLKSAIKTTDTIASKTKWLRDGVNNLFTKVALNTSKGYAKEHAERLSRDAEKAQIVKEFKQEQRIKFVNEQLDNELESIRKFHVNYTLSKGHVEKIRQDILAGKRDNQLFSGLGYDSKAKKCRNFDDIFLRVDLISYVQDRQQMDKEIFAKQLTNPNSYLSRLDVMSVETIKKML